jgi:nucleotide-binding universal stress UspA family protein
LKDYSINVVGHTDEEGGILEFSKQVKGDLIAIGTHGRQGISHFVHGSIAEDVVNHASGLVWTYAPRKQPVEG